MAKYLDYNGLQRLKDKAILKGYYNIGAYDSVDTSNSGYDLITRQTGYLVVRGDSFNWSADNPYSNFYSIYANGVLPDVVIGTTGDPSDPLWSQILVYGDNGFVGTSRGNVLDKCVMIQPGTSAGRTYLLFRDTSTSSKEELIAKLNANPVLIQYKLNTSYTEKVIKNAPLNTLDQKGSQWLREEWEKGLNKPFDYNVKRTDFGLTAKIVGHTITVTGTPSSAGQGNYLNINKVFDGTYTLSFRISSSGGTRLFVESIKNSSRSWDNVNNSLTLTFNSGDTLVQFYTISDNTNAVNITCDLMLVEGSHPYPYEEYNGNIIHEKDITPTLLWENSSPTSAFSGGDITTLDMSKYKYIYIEKRDDLLDNDSVTWQKFTYKTGTLCLSSTAVYSSQARPLARTFTINSGTSISWSADGYRGSSALNSICIPLKIYGSNY